MYVRMFNGKQCMERLTLQQRKALLDWVINGDEHARQIAPLIHGHASDGKPTIRSRASQVFVILPLEYRPMFGGAAGVAMNVEYL
jgi:hypothetical protein